MPNYSYAYKKFDKSRQVRSAIREKDISHKHAREISLAIKNLSIEKARVYLESVLRKEIAVPFRRHNNEVAHRSNIQDVLLELWDELALNLILLCMLK